jgi:alpha-L-rhamnosidase
MQRREFIGYSSIGVLGSFLIPTSIIASTDEKIVVNPLPKTAKFIWSDTEGSGRNVYANFRKSFKLSEKPQKALFNIFVDTSYQLFINGNFIQQGPVRFDPKYPVYDTHDLAQYLVIGENVIAIQANYFGMKTYKSIANSAGFLSWGEISAGKTKISLDSNTNNWKVIKAGERDRYVQKLSFALNPADFFDQSKEEANWKQSGYDDSKWTPAKELKKQDLWGKAEPRGIPFMSGSSVAIKEVKGVYPLMKLEDLYSFAVPFPDFYEEDKKMSKKFYQAFYTWIYSEKDQIVNVGTYWGESWLNGKEVSKGVESETQSIRITRQFNIQKGWNYLFGKVGPYSDLLTNYLAFPTAAKVIVSANKSLENANIKFKISPSNISAEDFNKYLLPKTLPYSEGEKIAEVGGWIDVKAEDKAQSPCVETNWDVYDNPIENLKANELNKKVFNIKDYPEGFSILMDIDFMHLSFPVIDVEGVKGATVDFTYSEQLTTDSAHLKHLFNYLPGDRVVCNKDKLKWMPSNPRGIRYIKLTFRNISSDIRINSFTIRSANYPVIHKGEFKSSDAMMNEIWKMGERTQEANMEDVYVDCSGRERGMYLRDTIIQYFNNLATFGDQALMRRCMELFLQSPDATGKFRAVYPNNGDYTISDFSLNGLEGLKAYYENTGDKELINRYWDAIVKNLAWFDELSDQRNDLLLDSEWHTKRKINAHYGGFHGDLGIKEGHMQNTGIHCVFSTTYLIALQSAYFLSNELGKKEYAAALKTRIDKLSVSIVAKFWNPELGCFSDNLERGSHSVHASLFAVRAGLVDSTKLELIKKHVSKELKYIFVNGYSPDGGVICSPSFSFYIFDGLYKAGLENIAEDIIKQGWGWALYNGMKTTPEYFSKDPGGSLCHAWSASPTYFFSKYALGINFPKAPDLSYVEIKVQTASITEMEGKYPHPKGGVIEVKWHTENGKRVFDYVKAPDGVQVKVIG